MDCTATRCKHTNSMLQGASMDGKIATQHLCASSHGVLTNDGVCESTGHTCVAC
jgi:hypothetical protein